MMAYCDYIAKRIKEALTVPDPENNILGHVGNVNYDLGEKGEFYSTMKTIHVLDVAGKRYKITVEEN
jgi:hypothetical protein